MSYCSEGQNLCKHFCYTVYLWSFVKHRTKHILAWIQSHLTPHLHFAVSWHFTLVSGIVILPLCAKSRAFSLTVSINTAPACNRKFGAWDVGKRKWPSSWYFSSNLHSHLKLKSSVVQRLLSFLVSVILVIMSCYGRRSPFKAGTVL